MTRTTPTRLRILHVEDNPGDARLVEEAFAEMASGDELRTVSEGRAALDLLVPDDDSPRFVPDIVLLDRELPDVSGIEIVREIKTDADLRHIPIIVLTDSDDEEHIREMYEAQANAYVTKPSGLDGYYDIFYCLQLFWGQMAKISPEGVER